MKAWPYLNTTEERENIGLVPEQARAVASDKCALALQQSLIAPRLTAASFKAGALPGIGRLVALGEPRWLAHCCSLTENAFVSLGTGPVPLCFMLRALLRV